jgi:type I restriction enzyme, R subunit
MNKKALTETDIRTKFITPALIGSTGDKWNVMTQIREEAYFTKGPVVVRGKTIKRGEAKKADYIKLSKSGFSDSVHERTTFFTVVRAGSWALLVEFHQMSICASASE